MKKLIIGIIMLFMLISLFADFTPLINYQGKLQENNVPVNATLNMEFKIYDSLSGGNQLWSSGIVSVSVKDGVFSYNLGTDNSTGFNSINWDGDKYIELTIEGETLLPREKMTAVAYSFNSGKTLFIKAENIDIGNGNVLSSIVGNGGKIKSSSIEGF